MKRASELRQGIARAQDRKLYAQRLLAQFDATAGNSEDEKRTRRKLEADIARAENDEQILQRALEETRPALSHSEARAFAEGIETGEDS